MIVSDNEQINLQHVLVGRAVGKDAAIELNISKLEQQAIQRAIKQYDGNLTRVAKALGLGRTTLYRKMEKYGLSD